MVTGIGPLNGDQPVHHHFQIAARRQCDDFPQVYCRLFPVPGNDFTNRATISCLQDSQANFRGRLSRTRALLGVSFERPTCL